MVGVLSSDRITHEDLISGAYRDAHIIEHLVDWKFPNAGAIESTDYWINKVEMTDHQWKAEVGGLARFLSPSVGEVYGRNCRHALGNEMCKVNILSYSTPGVSVESISNARTQFTPYPRLGEEFIYGKLIWESGSNLSTSQEILLIDTETGVVSLSDPAPRNIQEGDTLSAFQGCDRLRVTCHEKFNNAENFGGFPFIPNRDALIEVPGLSDDE